MTPRLQTRGLALAVLCACDATPTARVTLEPDVGDAQTSTPFSDAGSSVVRDASDGALGTDGGLPDAGPADAGVVDCNGLRCRGTTFGGGFVGAPCCYDERLCGVRIVEAPVPVTDVCIGWGEPADANTDCAANDPSGSVYDYGCCLPDGTCGARFAGPDASTRCIDAASLGLASGASCDPANTCGLAEAPCEVDADCCAFPPTGHVCAHWNGGKGACTARCGKDFECASGCCRSSDEGDAACAPPEVCETL